MNTTTPAIDLSSLPRPKVKLKGIDGNAFAIIGHVSKALKGAGWTREQVEAFTSEAMAGDYDALLRTCLKYTSK